MNAYHPSLPDMLILALLAIVSAVEYFAVSARRGRITSSFRVAWYVQTIVVLWALAAGIVALWMAAHRSWDALLLGSIHPSRLLAGFVPVTIYLLLVARDLSRVLKRTSFSEQFMAGINKLIELMPHTRLQFALFMLVAVAAGCCEELIFRGFLLSFIAAFAGPVAAVIASSFFSRARISRARRHYPQRHLQPGGVRPGAGGGIAHPGHRHSRSHRRCFRGCRLSRHHSGKNAVAKRVRHDPRRCGERQRLHGFGPSLKAVRRVIERRCRAFCRKTKWTNAAKNPLFRPFRIIGGAVGELPPESEKPSRRFLQATASILAFAHVSSKPGFYARQILQFRTIIGSVSSS